MKKHNYYLLTWKYPTSIVSLDGFYIFDEISYLSLKSDLENYLGDIEDTFLKKTLKDMIDESQKINEEKFKCIRDCLGIQIGRDLIKEFYDKFEEE